MNTELLRNIKPFEQERYLGKYEFSAKWLLCCSDCESVTVDDILNLEAGAKDRFLSMGLGYTETDGSPGLRKEIAAQYDSIAFEDVLVHAGAQEAIYNFMRSLLRPGDEVIVQYPCYQSLYEVARAVGCRISFWHMKNDGKNWQVDIDDLKKLVTPYTRALVINTPHNPTGYVLGADEKRNIAELADQSSIVVFSDEVYRFTEFEKPSTSLCDISKNAVSLGVMSKSFGLPGLRIGWIASHNHEVLKLMKEYKDYTTICSSGPSEFLAEVALRNSRVLISRNLELIKSNLALLEAQLLSRAEVFTWMKPEGSPVAFVEIKGTDAGRFCQNLVDAAGVLLLPGSVFGREYSNFIRFGMGRKNMPEALKIFTAYLDAQ